jgi:hypothetical protein
MSKERYWQCVAMLEEAVADSYDKINPGYARFLRNASQDGIRLRQKTWAADQAAASKEERGAESRSWWGSWRNCFIGPKGGNGLEERLMEQERGRGA